MFERKANVCPNSVTCKKCSGTHATIICHRHTINFKQFTNYNYNSEHPTKNSFLQNKIRSNIKQTSDYDQGLPVAHTHTHNNVTNKQTILKCVKAKIYNPENTTINVEILILFDNGSTTRYITDDFYTIITEIEHIINTRLLTYTSQEINNELVLRPIDFLGINSKNFLPFFEKG